MIDPLQGFGFQESNYERPNQEWECGWAAQGEPCHIGPDNSGTCQAHRECMPYKEGDRYRCARPRSFGGECALGPGPDGTCSQRVLECQPVRALRSKRKLFTYSAAATALGACLIMFGGPWSDTFISPGELTLQHHSKVHKCADCHSAAEGTFAQWVGSAIGAGGADAAISADRAATGAAGHASTGASGDSARCLACHDNLGTNPMLAHGLDLEQLTALGESPRAASAGRQPMVFSLLDAAAFPMRSAGGLRLDETLACALCHREHRGREFDLTQMSNVQCQTCHTARFHSFAEGHPEIDGYPYGRRTRIHFDHVTHYRVHFDSFRRVKAGAVLPEELRDFGDGAIPAAASCKACHQPDPAGRTMPIRGFEHSCAACHGPEIEEDALPGLALLSIPGLSEEMLAADGPAVGQWPRLTGATDAGLRHGSETEPQQIPPLMELLLRGDADYLAARDALRTTDWSSLSEQDAAAAKRDLLGRQLWSMKRLIHELAEDGQAAATRRLNHLKPLLAARGRTSVPDPGRQLASLSASLFDDPSFVEALAAAKENWFPNLSEEIEQFDQNALPPRFAESGPVPVEVTMGEASSGWYATLADGSIRYRVKGHSDRLVRSVLDFAGRVPDVAGVAARSEDRATTATSAAGAAQAALSQLFGVLGDPAASWRCLGCHTADRQDDGRLTINWLGRHVRPDSQSFTRFSHAPHLTLLAKDDCGACHMPQEQVNFVREEFVRYRDGFTVNTDPHSALTSGFLPVEKSGCAECHTSKLAGDSCLKCHNYHIFE